MRDTSKREFQSLSLLEAVYCFDLEFLLVPLMRFSSTHSRLNFQLKCLANFPLLLAVNSQFPHQLVQLEELRFPDRYQCFNGQAQLKDFQYIQLK